MTSRRRMPRRTTLVAIAALFVVCAAVLVNYAGQVSADSAARAHQSTEAAVSMFGPQAKPLDRVPPDEPAKGLVYHGLAAVKTGPCVGGYQVMGITRVMCTHGPDAPKKDVNVKVSVKPLSVQAAAAVAAAGLPVCEGDGTSGRRVEVLYIHGSTSRYSQYLATFRSVAQSVDTIYNASAQETGGERHIRYATETVDGVCQPVVRDVTIDDTALNANDWAPLDNAVQALGYNRTDRKYLEFVDANVYCGIGGFPGDTTKSANNRANNGPDYARVDNGCWADWAAAHELGHNFGAVNDDAPNSSKHAHCTDEFDVMCYQDADDTVMHTACPDRSHDSRLDCNHDDYYNTNPSPGSYLAREYNVADNLFLIKGNGTTTTSPSASASASPSASRSAGPSPSSSASPSPSPTPSTATPFYLVNNASNTCLDDPGRKTTDGTQLIIYTCHNGTNQRLTASSGTLRILGKCVTAAGTGTGSAVVLATCSGAQSQQWTLNTDGTVSSTQSNSAQSQLCMAPKDAATKNLTGVVLNTCTAANEQLWLAR